MKKLLFVLLLACAPVQAEDGLIQMLRGNLGLFRMGNVQFKAQVWQMDLPRTFESGSCIAAGGKLLLSQPGVTWYCWEDYKIEPLR